MLIRPSADVSPSEITPRSIYFRRREFISGATGVGLSALFELGVKAAPLPSTKSQSSTDEQRTPLKDILSYNNFYEFGPGKADPAAYARKLTVRPWTVNVNGLVAKPAQYQLEDFIKPFALEERVYRMRCVEGWSMVIPWIGFPLSEVLKRAEPLRGARYVAFQSLLRPEEMPGQNSLLPLLEWPYVEGLRLDEAMHPLTIFAVGLYGETLANQNGAPLRLVVPWKYGFKGIKSVIRISLVENRPQTSWNKQNPSEYGFYSNVNPRVDHPRWSQATERRIGEGGLFAKRRPTLMFNGYGDEVASL